MEREKLRAVASQLAHPSGEMGDEISGKMNDTNALITARAIEAFHHKRGYIRPRIPVVRRACAGAGA